MFDIARAILHRFGGHHVACEPRDVASHEVSQHGTVVEALHAARVGNQRGLHAERYDVGQRIGFPAHGRRFLPPASDAAIEHVENRRGKYERRSELDVARNTSLYQCHEREQRSNATHGTAQRKPIDPVELPHHGKGLRVGSCVHARTAEALSVTGHRPTTKAVVGEWRLSVATERHPVFCPHGARQFITLDALWLKSAG